VKRPSTAGRGEEMSKYDVEYGRLLFTNCKPSAYCGLGEIPWQLLEEDAICPIHGEIKLEEVKLVAMIYDGCNWENPSCPHCGNIFVAFPLDLDEREIIVRHRKKITDLLNGVG